MVDPLSIIALSLTCFHGCVQGLVLLSKASDYDRDLSNLRLQIELELQSLFTWAEAAGLTQEPPTLHMSISHARFVPEILEQLQSLILDIGQLKTRHGLDLRFLDEELQRLDDGTSTLSTLGPKPSAVNGRLDKTVFQKKKSPWKKLKWISCDDSKAQKLLEQVRGYVSKLEKFLEQSRQATRGAILDGVLRDAVLNLDDNQKLEIIGRTYLEAPSSMAVASAARLKQYRVELGLENASPSQTTIAIRTRNSYHGRTDSRNGIPGPARRSSSSFHVMRLSMRLLMLPDRAQTAHARTLAEYNKKRVLLEWKGTRDKHTAFLENRVDQVAGFLHHLKPSFHSLPCLGYVKDHEHNQYGFVFELPPEFQTPGTAPGGKDRSSSPQMISLAKLISKKEIAPSLNVRISIAMRVLENVLNLHTAGWLHKELRSENVILICETADATIKNTDVDPRSIYIAGYVSARADDPGEMTEAVDQNADADLYRHPRSLGNARDTFCKAFDIFSVGLTLLEIALWTRFRDILEWHHSLERASDRPKLSKSATFASTMSGNTLANHDAEDDSQDDNCEKNIGKANVRPDLMELRESVLLSQLQQRKTNGKTNRKTAKNKQGIAGFHRRCQILQSAEAAVGTAYTDIIEEMLSIGLSAASGQEGDADQHEYALDLQMRAVATLERMSQALRGDLSE